MTRRMLLRLSAQLPGWKVWFSTPGGWTAVPAPPGTPLAEAVLLPGKVRARTPEELVAACRAREREQRDEPPT